MKIIISFFVLFAFSIQTQAQIATLTLVCANSPTIDGTVSAGEWEDSDTVRLFVGTNKSVQISFKRDLENMYFLFSGNLESQFKFPEILFDVDNSKTNAWQTDDWWFHISATDCEYSGAYGIYSNCLLVQPDWVALNNITQGQPITDTVEISIPFSKIGFIESETNTRFGLCFLLNGFNTGITIWPALANKLDPSTWGEMILERPYCNATDIKLTDIKSAFKLYPNPSDRIFTLLSEEINLSSYKFQILDFLGNIVPFKSTNTFGKIELELEEEPGIYFLQILNSQKLIQTIKLIIK